MIPSQALARVSLPNFKTVLSEAVRSEEPRMFEEVLTCMRHSLSNTEVRHNQVRKRHTRSLPRCCCGAGDKGAEL